jgi:TetR/AcrR family transcriptional regulator, transcriptional repressor for nem operon
MMIYIIIRDNSKVKLTKEQASSNRRQIIETAAQSFQERGVDAVCLNEIMKMAGFTHGGFYNHFASKDDLVAEAFAQAFAPAVKDAEAISKCDKDFARAIAGYLSEEHRDDPAHGCPTASLLCDAVRQNKAARKAYADGIESIIESFAGRMNGNKKEKRQAAINTLASMIGAVLLSRGIGDADDKLSKEILTAARSKMCAKGNAKKVR